MQTIKPKYRVNWHHRLLASKLQAVAEGKIKRLMVFMPARHGKSELLSRQWPAWLLARNIDEHIIASTYAQSLARRMARDVRKIIASKTYRELFPWVQVGGPNGTATQDEFTVGEEGHYIAAGVGAGITGSGFTVGIIDDPVKNAQEAASPVYRENSWDWFTSTFFTRQEGWESESDQAGGAIIVTCTRWDYDDLAGRALKLAQDNPEADQWEVISLPLISKEVRAPYDERTEAGQPLWPERYGEKYCKSLKATLPKRWYAAMADQDPIPDGGNHFQANWFNEIEWEYFNLVSHKDSVKVTKSGKVYTTPLATCEIFAVVDPAASEKQTADPTAIVVYAITPQRDLLILDADVDQMGLEAIPGRILNMTTKWPTCQFVGIEDSGFQYGVVLACNKIKGMLPIKTFPHEGKSKLVRATVAIVRAESGQIVFPADAPWKAKFLEELVRFTGVPGDRDDQVDTLSYAAIRLHARIERESDAEDKAEKQAENQRKPRSGNRGLWGQR